jgi:hypothetical protein
VGALGIAAESPTLWRVFPAPKGNAQKLKKIFQKKTILHKSK